MTSQKEPGWTPGYQDEMLSPEGAELLLASIDAADDFAALGLNATRSDSFSMPCFHVSPRHRS